MKITVAFSAICFLVLNLNERVDGRSSPRDQRPKLYVFGDSFADSGNLPKPHGLHRESEASRQWFFPYGVTAGRPTGRFSNGMVQSDFIAKIMGHPRAPPAYSSSRAEQNGGGASASASASSGVNFAAGGAGVFPVPHNVPTLCEQVDQFAGMIDDGSVVRRPHLRGSVALVAVSGNDYARAAGMSSDDEVVDFIGNVTTEMVRQVRRLRELGVAKVLVNNLHPLGCTPWQSRPSNYTACSFRGNMATRFHSVFLEKKLAANAAAAAAAAADDDGSRSQEEEEEEDVDLASSRRRGVFLVDLRTAFSNIVNTGEGYSSPLSRQFSHKMMPCCDSFDPNGFCGQRSGNNTMQYNICPDPKKYFYWDNVHPTEAGWMAVMDQLEKPIRKFLGL